MHMGAIFFSRNRLRSAIANRSAALVLVLAALLGLAALPVTASAQDSADRTVFWHLQYDDAIDAAQRERFDNELMRVLSRAHQTHLVTGAALLTQLRRQPVQIPPCFEGAAPCTSTPEQLAQALHVDGVVQGRLSPADASGQFVLQLDYFREFGGGPRSVQKVGRVDEIVGPAVAELFTLAARITIYSDPPGAALFVNGKRLGETPIEFSAGEGLHGVRLVAEGYEDLREDLSVTPGQELERTFALRPLLTQLTVLTRAPDAEVWVDGNFRGMAGDSIDVAPGGHQVELRAPGYRPISVQVDLRAAQRRTVSLAMLRQVEDSWSRRERGITRYPLYAEVGYDLFFQSGEFSGVSGEPYDETLTVRGFDGERETSLLFNGATLAAGWTHDIFGLSIIGVQLAGANMDGTIDLVSKDGVTRRIADARSVFHVGVYPLQPTVRWLLGAFALDARTGLGLAFDRFAMRLDDDDFALSEVNGFWNLNLGARYYWAEEWYLSLGYGLELDFTDTRAPRHGLQLRVGYNLPLLVDDGTGATAPPVAPLDDDDLLPEEPPVLPDSLPPLRGEPSESQGFEQAPALPGEENP